MATTKVNWRAVETITGLVIEETLAVTGATTLTGGLGLASALAVTDDTDASGVGSGSINTAGGLSTTKKLYVGTDLVIVAGDIDLSSATSGTYDMILKDSVADALSIRRAATDMIVFNTSTPLITITPALKVMGGLWQGAAGWGAGYNTGAILIADDQAGTALAYGAGTSGVCVERVNVTAAMTSGSYFFGKYATYATSAAMEDGFIMGNYTKVSLDHIGYENYAVRGRMCVNVAQTGDTGNQYIGMFGAVEMASGAHALLDTGGAYGVLGTASLAGGSLDQPLIAGYFDCNAVVDVAGGSYAVRARMQGYTDYGLQVFSQSANSTAGICIDVEQSAVLPVGIQFQATSGSITKAFKFAAASGCGVAANTNNMGDNPTSHHIVVDIAGTDYYVPVYDNIQWN